MDRCSLRSQLSAPPSRKAFPILSNPGTSETNSAIPTAAQLAETRQRQWHQQGEALLTIENLRSWINTAGLVLFAPRPQIASPAPSLVEAVLGAPNSSPTLEQTAEARSLLARLVAEGLAVPLNLLGPGAGTVHAAAPGDTPDFVASTAVFSYVFTLRGDKAWKQPPASTGALKMSNLALATYEALSRRGPLSAYDLTTEVGKEVTEAAVLRALGELWTHLRVLPLAQPEGAPTLWELTSVRFTKQIKAGANAGQPSALSALISLYLGQAAVASEDEIESFLSPLASRSRIRDVIHALLSARQLETIAVEGRTMLHVAGSLPAFLAPQAAVAASEPEAAAVEQIEVEASAPQDADVTGEAAPRITKFVAKPRKIGTGYHAKAKPAKFGAKPGPFERGSKPSSRPSFKPREGFASPSPRERRPFSKPTSPGFDKPWDEEKTRRLAAASKPSQVPDNESGVATNKAGSTAPRTPRVYKPRTEGAGDRRTFGSKPAFRGKPSFGDKPRFGSDARPPRRDFAPRGESSDARAPRKTFSKPGTFGRKREGFAAREPGSYKTCLGHKATGLAAGKRTVPRRASRILHAEPASSVASRVPPTTATSAPHPARATARTEAPLPTAANASTASSTHPATVPRAPFHPTALRARSRPTDPLAPSVLISPANRATSRRANSLESRPGSPADLFASLAASPASPARNRDPERLSLANPPAHLTSSPATRSPSANARLPASSSPPKVSPPDARPATTRAQSAQSPHHRYRRPRRRW